METAAYLISFLILVGALVTAIAAYCEIKLRMWEAELDFKKISSMLDSAAFFLDRDDTARDAAISSVRYANLIAIRWLSVADRAPPPDVAPPAATPPSGAAGQSEVDG